MTDLTARIQRLSEPQRRLLRLRLENMQRKRTGGDAHLVGYIVPRIMGGSFTAQDLRAFLNVRMPDYMVPSTWVFIEAFPVTSRGKIDRQALLAKARTASTGVTQVVPRNECERAIADIWGELLGLPAAGLHDNFFELGGHSLLLPKVLTKVRAIASREVSMVDLFRYPTVEALAAYVAAAPAPVTDAQTTKQIKDKQEAGARRMQQRRAQQAVMRTK
ncbi:MAG: polyketide synthase module [Nitrospira sp.]|jgi:hypothetical protein|nr:MAG: polyketide synthase module [Nitrospira sp.]